MMGEKIVDAEKEHSEAEIWAFKVEEELRVQKEHANVL